MFCRDLADKAVNLAASLLEEAGIDTPENKALLSEQAIHSHSLCLVISLLRLHGLLTHKNYTLLIHQAPYAQEISFPLLFLNNSGIFTEENFIALILYRNYIREISEKSKLIIDTQGVFTQSSFDKIIQDIRVKQAKIAFLMGDEARVGARTSIKLFLTGNSHFDRNVLREVFNFFQKQDDTDSVHCAKMEAEGKELAFPVKI